MTNRGILRSGDLWYAILLYRGKNKCAQKWLETEEDVVRSRGGAYISLHVK